MTDKKTFGSFIKLKRTEKNYSQKDLAEMLFVTEGAVSKWERGVSYPDITLISDICRILDISEHELITSSNDTDTRRMKHEARKYRVIRSAWFWIPTISYAIALLTCFICNIAVNHTLSWFFIVFASLICAYTFIPSCVGFFNCGKLIVFCCSTYLSIFLLLFTCAIYTNGISWLLTAAISILIGYTAIFVPVLLRNTNISRYKFLISFSLQCCLTILLLLNINIWNPIKLIPSILITLYAFIPAIICCVISIFRFDAFVKTGICIAVCAVFYYFAELVVDILFGFNDRSYQVNFNDWNLCLEGNIYLISILSLLFISMIFAVVGICRIIKKASPK